MIDAGASPARLPLSVIVISHNMGRELPRTVRTLSPAMQRGVGVDDYEIIVIDNGSQAPPDRLALRAIAPNLSVHRMEGAKPSPVAAINRGLELARGELVGVCIDGARMVSPGMLNTAMRAARLHARPVIGTLSFHLGPKMQTESMLEGYDQRQEDLLLSQTRWEEDGYSLFDISVFAGSSRDGWFVTPNETNALFLAKPHWLELGGFDARFNSPGGGLANLDMWRRACDDVSGELIMLLGEATFHQFHGGVATNSVVSPWAAFHEEYVALRAMPYRKSKRQARFYGSIHPRMASSMGQSLGRYAELSRLDAPPASPE